MRPRPPRSTDHDAASSGREGAPGLRLYPVAAAFVAHDVMTDRLHNASKLTNVPFKRLACDGDGPAIFD